LFAKENSWEPLFNSLDHFTKDFEMTRNQPKDNQERELMFK